MAHLTPQQAFDAAVGHLHAGRLAEAREIGRQLLAIHPENADVLYLLGLIAREAGVPSEAADFFRRAVGANPANPALHRDYGNALQSLGRFEQAVAAYVRAVELQPADATLHSNLGNALQAQGRLDDAIAAFGQAVRLAPNVAEIQSNLASALLERGRLDEAIAAARRAIALKPNHAMAYNNLGVALLEQLRVDEAMAAFEQALALQPRLALAHANLGNARTKQGRMDDAIAAYRRALDVEPNLPLALCNLANALHAQWKLDEALPIYRRAAEAPGCPPAVYDNYLIALHYWAEITPQKLLEAHEIYDRRYGQPLRHSWRTPTGSRQPGRRLRLGFISPCFCFHAVGYFLVRLLENLNGDEWEIVCYADARRKSDTMTTRLRTCADAWHEVTPLSDEALAQRIHDDGIDILFDLAGHTAGNRLLVFARKPAPIQITWLDYVGTTGLSAMDYLLADSRQIPPEAEKFYGEKILRLPDDYICFDPPSEAPEVGPLPALAHGFVTFASFNIAPKITAAAVRVWGRILRAVPGARLVLKNQTFDSRAVSEPIQRLFAEEAITSDRIIFQGWSPHRELLANYNEVDIGLDTFPYNGGLTTCEALWMGVPVVTYVGATFAGRHGLTHLTAAGLTETIARDLDEYVNIAVALANDLPRLAALRSTLRERVAASPLCDGPRFAKNFGNLMREVWQRGCGERV